MKMVLSCLIYFVIVLLSFGFALSVGGSNLGTKSGRQCRKLELSFGNEQPIFYEMNPASGGRIYLPFSINAEKVAQKNQAT
jgi:hypothetical protein